MQTDLTPRQREILGHVVDAYVASGQPVGSKTLVARSRLGVSSSTVRYELAELEGLGLLTHPHTSAGRVPTDRGYRLYVDALLERLDPRPPAFPLNLTGIRSEVDAALQATTDMLSQITSLLALVSAPPAETTTVRHVEVLLLQPHAVVVVVIASTGDVSRRVFGFDDAVDTGLANWAGEYLNERMAGVQLGTRRFRERFEDPGLSRRERAFLDRLRPAFTELMPLDQRLYVGGTAGLLDDVRADELGAYRRLFEVLEKRASLLEILSDALDPRRPFVRVGEELENPALRGVALVGACYGLANRALGAVSLLGPRRMDYDKALRSVRAAASELSRFIEEVYAEN